jgi:CheY-like chemotaxis protein
VLILTARDSSADKIAGLDAGADDYLTKPFDLVRTAGAPACPDPACRRRCDADPRTRRRGARPGQQTGDPGRPAGQPVGARVHPAARSAQPQEPCPHTRSQLEESLYAWGEETGSNTVEVYIHHLRKKLGANFIRTVRGLGYQLGGAD